VIELTPEDRLGIGPAQVTSCQDKEGAKGAPCDSPDFDKLVHPHLIGLLGCAEAGAAVGTLSLGFKADLGTGTLSAPKSGRSTNLPDPTTKALLACAGKAFASVKLGNLSHKFEQYQVYYSLEFKTSEMAAAEKVSVTAASGQATVQWPTAQVRKEPVQGAEVQARLLAGARVVVSGKTGEWYRIKYDARGREGWIHGAALGLQ
jgi:hypothetical protein